MVVAGTRCRARFRAGSGEAVASTDSESSCRQPAAGSRQQAAGSRRTAASRQRAGAQPEHGGAEQVIASHGVRIVSPPQSNMPPDRKRYFAASFVICPAVADQWRAAGGLWDPRTFNPCIKSCLSSCLSSWPPAPPRAPTTHTTLPAAR